MSYVTDVDHNRLQIAHGQRGATSAATARQVNAPAATQTLPGSAFSSSETIVTNYGASGNVTVTLPAASAAFVGCRVTTVQIGANTITLAPTAGPRVVCVQNSATPTFAWLAV